MRRDTQRSGRPGTTRTRRTTPSIGSGTVSTSGRRAASVSVGARSASEMRRSGGRRASSGPKSGHGSIRRSDSRRASDTSRSIRRRTSKLSATTTTGIVTRSPSAGGRERLRSRRRPTRLVVARSPAHAPPAVCPSGHPVPLNRSPIGSERMKRGACTVVALVPDCPTADFTGCWLRSGVRTTPPRTRSSLGSAAGGVGPDQAAGCADPTRVGARLAAPFGDPSSGPRDPGDRRCVLH